MKSSSAINTFGIALAPLQLPLFSLADNKRLWLLAGLSLASPRCPDGGAVGNRREAM
jgi:hypothetical protein